MRWIEISHEIGDIPRSGLVLLRDRLVNAIERSDSGRDIAAMSRRLIDVLNELEALPDESAKNNPAQKAREMVRNRGSS